ncbi:MAG: DNA-deoxyinosine glycosylase [Nevskiales bacterium]
MKSNVVSFEPAALDSARVLILGSIPGKASLDAGEYYAHPRNAFWKIMGQIVGLTPDGPYSERLAALLASGIALWDVLHSCEREGSLDANIDAKSMRPNDFNDFFCKHQSIKLVCFNGAKAEHCYRMHVLPTLERCSIVYAALPSTSPAHAALPFAGKVTAWRAILGAEQYT